MRFRQNQGHAVDRARETTGAARGQVIRGNFNYLYAHTSRRSVAHNPHGRSDRELSKSIPNDSEMTRFRPIRAGHRCSRGTAPDALPSSKPKGRGRPIDARVKSKRSLRLRSRGKPPGGTVFFARNCVFACRPPRFAHRRSLPNGRARENPAVYRALDCTWERRRGWLKARCREASPVGARESRPATPPIQMTRAGHTRAAIHRRRRVAPRLARTRAAFILPSRWVS